MLSIYDTLDPPVRCQMSFQPRSFGDFFGAPNFQGPNWRLSGPPKLGMVPKKKSTSIFIYTLYQVGIYWVPISPF